MQLERGNPQVRALALGKQVQKQLERVWVYEVCYSPPGDSTTVLTDNVRSCWCLLVQLNLHATPSRIWYRQPTIVYLSLLPYVYYPVSGRVVNISSLVGSKALENCSENLQEKFRCETLTEEDLVDLMKKFVEDTRNEVHEREGWPSSAYGVSKLGVTVLSRILARRLDETRKGDRILLNACCPGWVKTDMAGDYGSRTVEEGAETPIYLALLPPDATEPQGQLVHDKVVQNWWMSSLVPAD